MGVAAMKALEVMADAVNSDVFGDRARDEEILGLPGSEVLRAGVRIGWPRATCHLRSVESGMSPGEMVPIPSLHVDRARALMLDLMPENFDLRDRATTDPYSDIVTASSTGVLDSDLLLDGADAVETWSGIAANGQSPLRRVLVSNLWSAMDESVSGRFAGRPVVSMVGMGIGGSSDHLNPHRSVLEALGDASVGAVNLRLVDRSLSMLRCNAANVVGGNVEDLPHISHILEVSSFSECPVGAVGVDVVALLGLTSSRSDEDIGKVYSLLKPGGIGAISFPTINRNGISGHPRVLQSLGSPSFLSFLATRFRELLCRAASQVHSMSAPLDQDPIVLPPGVLTREDVSSSLDFSGDQTRFVCDCRMPDAVRKAVSKSSLQVDLPPSMRIFDMRLFGTDTAEVLANAGLSVVSSSHDLDAPPVDSSHIEPRVVLIERA